MVSAKLADSELKPRRRVLFGWLALVAVFVLWGTTYNAIALGFVGAGLARLAQGHALGLRPVRYLTRA